MHSQSLSHIYIDLYVQLKKFAVAFTDTRLPHPQYITWHDLSSYLMFQKAECFYYDCRLSEIYLKTELLNLQQCEAYRST